MTDIKKLRDETGAGVIDIRQALENAEGDFAKAREELLKKAASKAEKRAERTAGDGLVHAYTHSNGKVGSLIVLACETDFVAKTEDFKQLCHNIAMQICTDSFDSLEAVLNSEYIKDPSKKISDLITEATGKTGEKIELKKFVKFSVNE